MSSQEKRMKRTRRKSHSTQDVDVEASFSIEDETKARGFYIGLIGSLLKWAMTILGSIMVISAQLDANALYLSFVFVTFFLLGWVMTREAGIESFTTYDTVFDQIAYGSVLGFVIRIAEQVTLALTTGNIEMNYLAPFDTFLNAPAIGNAFTFLVVGLVFAAVAEELLHRGGMVYLIVILTDRRGMSYEVAAFLALFIQALSFAFLHVAVYQMPQQIFALFIGGLLFGGVLLWKKDLGVCMIAHLTINLSALLPYAAGYFIANPVALLAIILSVGVLVWCMARRGG